MKVWKVYYHSRYCKFDKRTRLVSGYKSRSEIRVNWHNIMLTDEYVIDKIEEIQ